MTQISLIDSCIFHHFHCVIIAYSWKNILVVDVRYQTVHAGGKRCYPRVSDADVKIPPMPPEKNEERIVLDSNSNEDVANLLSSTSHAVGYLLQSLPPEEPDNVMVGMNEQERLIAGTPRNSDNCCNIM